MDNKTLVFVMVSMSATALCAKTIGLWHFEESGYGRSTSGMAGEIVNAISSEYGSGRAVTISTANVIGQDVDLMPQYDLPAALSVADKGTVYDPVSGQTWTSTGALRMPVVGTTTATRAGGAVIIGNDERFSLTTYTVECFMKLPRNYQALNTYGPIVGKVKGTAFYTESWALLLLNSGKLAFRYNGTGTSYTSPLPGTAVVNDGEWHHLALVCKYDEGANKSVWNIYCDGKFDFSAEKAGPTEYSAVVADKDNGGIFVGGYKYDGRKSDLRIDDLRISDEALPPEKFLRLVPSGAAPEVVTDKTIAWLPFDMPSGISATSELIGRNFNSVTNVRARLVSGAHSSCAPDADVPAARIREGFLQLPTCINESSLQFQTNGVGLSDGCYVDFDEYDWFSDDFTVETYFKTGDGDYTGSHTILDFSDIKLFLYSSNRHYMTLSYRPNADADIKVATCSSQVCDDGAWHHLAAVYRKAQGRILVYVDHLLEKEVSGVDLNPVARKAQVGIYRSGGTNRQLFDGSIDSLRITREALDPSRFLNGRANVEEPETLFRASFEQNLEAFSEAGYFTTGISGRYTKTGSEDPSYASETNWGARIYRDGEARKHPVDNGAVLRLKGSTVSFPSQNQLTTGEQTCEFFCKLMSLDAMCGLVRINRSASSATGTPVWALYSEKGVAETESMLIRLYGLKNGAGSASDQYLTLPSAGRIFDGRWHHVALTFAESAGNKTTITMYKDYEVLSSVVFDGRLADNVDAKYMVSLGMGGDLSRAGLEGWVDELRISRGVLPVEKFMRAEKVPSGMLLIFR